MSITLSTKTLIKTLWLTLAALLGFYLLTFYLPSIFQVQPPLGESWTKTFNFLEENNLPTLFSTVLFFFAAAVSGLISRSFNGPHKNHWAYLGALFILCGIDETVCFHEQISFAMQHSLGFQGALYYSWIIPATLLVLGLTAVYVPVIAKLPARSRLKILAGGILFVTGAIGFEPIQGWIVSNGHYFQMERLAITLASIEETLELAGLILFVDGSLEHLTSLSPDLSLRIAP